MLIVALVIAVAIVLLLCAGLYAAMVETAALKRERDQLQTNLELYSAVDGAVAEKLAQLAMRDKPVEASQPYVTPAPWTQATLADEPVVTDLPGDTHPRTPDYHVARPPALSEEQVTAIWQAKQVERPRESMLNRAETANVASVEADRAFRQSEAEKKRRELERADCYGGAEPVAPDRKPKTGEPLPEPFIKQFE